MKYTRHLNRLRPPKVQITYDLESCGAIKKTSLPLLFGLFGWPENILQAAQLYQSNQIKIRHLDFKFSNLLAELINLNDLTDSQLYKLIYWDESGTNGGQPYSAIFVRGMNCLSQKELTSLNALAKVCHTIFVFDHFAEASFDYDLLIVLCQQFESTGWFQDTRLPLASLEIIHGNESLDRDLSGLMRSLCGARFAHYVMIIMRARMASLLSKSHLEDYLNCWISQYVLLDDPESDYVSASYPLRKANIVVKDIISDPPGYSATLTLHLGFGFDDEPDICLNCLPLLE